MKDVSLLFTLTISAIWCHAQKIPQAYFTHVKTADSLYNAKDFRNSAKKYSDAFKANGWKAKTGDRYNAACSWALTAVPDSAFFQLERISIIDNYSNYGDITTDQDLISLHEDIRWEPLIDRIKRNKEKADAKLNRPLMKTLDSIGIEDQTYRKQISGVEMSYGRESKEMKTLLKTMRENDSLNSITVKGILDKYGWLGPDEIGKWGNLTLFLVIQHSDITTQRKYLPMMRKAVKKGKAQSSSLALLEDRVALNFGKKQIYGSQIWRDPVTQLYYVAPLKDPDKVDKRRRDVGLGPLADYAIKWQIKWNVEQYKKDLPEFEANLKLKSKKLN